MTSRRSVLTGALSAGAVYGLDTRGGKRDTGLSLLRAPDYAEGFAEERIALSRSGDAWSAAGLEVRTEATVAELRVTVAATGLRPRRIHLRWNANVTGNPLILGDAWERSYGDLGWRPVIPERVMPWYFLVSNGGVVSGYGVKTGAAALCFWQLDGDGVSLWLDVSNGGGGVELGSRELAAATVVVRPGRRGEGPVEAAKAFCRLMCPKPRLAGEPIYGSNDWYYAYGKNSAAGTLRDADLIAELSRTNQVRPFATIDMGWSDGSATFPSMTDLAAEVKKKGVRPGLWIRPLEAPQDAESGLLLPAGRFGKATERARELAFDPTIPEALEIVTAKVKHPVGWGYELVKHDFSTYDLLGKWGREMGAEPSSAGWHLHDRTRTNAEVMLDLYRALRKAAGEQTLLIGCNTVGHLGAGLFEAQRTGDDTSGREWERTRRMGVNTLAFRLPQHQAFFAVDPDCVGVTTAIPWKLNAQWLDLVARSGVALFVSPQPEATGPEQRAAIRAAFERVASQKSHVVPADWTRGSAPESWISETGKEVKYQWSDEAGCWPFEV